MGKAEKTFGTLDDEHVDFILAEAARLVSSGYPGGEEAPLASSRDLCICIHNIDGVNLRAASVRDLLSVLATCPRIHIVASIDHVHGALLWDQRQSVRFNWIWHETVTYSPYALETLHEPPVVGGRDASSSRGAGYVLQSLTPNHVSVLQVLAKHQLGVSNVPARGAAAALAASTPSSRGMEFSELYNRCRDEMLVSNDRTLRNVLREFLDHELVAERRTAEGRILLYVCLPEAMIRSDILGFGDKTAATTL